MIKQVAVVPTAKGRIFVGLTVVTNRETQRQIDTQTHTQRERERERERSCYICSNGPHLNFHSVQRCGLIIQIAKEI